MYTRTENRTGPVEDWTETCGQCGLEVPWGTVNKEGRCMECSMLLGL